MIVQYNTSVFIFMQHIFSSFPRMPFMLFDLSHKKTSVISISRGILHIKKVPSSDIISVHISKDAIGPKVVKKERRQIEIDYQKLIFSC